MSEWTSLSCKSDTKARIAELKEDGETQDDVLNKALDALDGHTETQDVDLKEVFTKLERIENAQSNTVSEALELAEEAGEIKELLKDMDVVSNNQRVLTRIDDLETELKTHFERELGR